MSQTTGEAYATTIEGSDEAIHLSLQSNALHSDPACLSLGKTCLIGSLGSLEGCVELASPCCIGGDTSAPSLSSSLRHRARAAVADFGGLVSLHRSQACCGHIADDKFHRHLGRMPEYYAAL